VCVCVCVCVVNVNGLITCRKIKSVNYAIEVMH